MKPQTLVCLLLPLVFCLCAHAQHSVDWSTIDGGGGTSTGVVYSVSGTVGQPDAGVMSGGNFTLQGGYWSVVSAVQTPGAPLLSVAAFGSRIVVAWPAPAEGWLLERTKALTSAVVPWTPVLPP